MTWDQFKLIAWPDEFVVRCTDGTSLKLLKGDGVTYEPAKDNSSGRGMICATMFPARSGQRRLVGQCVYLDEIRSIEGEGGCVFWGLQ